jgi:NADPH-dependent ferric siderophore reductase
MSRKVRLTRVTAIYNIGTHLKRFVLNGPDLDDFPRGQDGAHVKVLLPHAGESLPNLDIKGENPAIKRSYTIREFDDINKELVIDFVIDCHRGPATDWAAGAKVGDCLGIAGPGSRKLTDFNAGSYLLIGDITSVNAVNGYAKFIQPQATIKALITVPTRSDIIEMDGGEQLQISWRVEDESPEDMVECVRKLAVNMSRNSQIFIGVEANQLREVKSMLLSELAFNRLNMHASGYWKKGMDADRFNSDKKSTPL